MASSQAWRELAGSLCAVASVSPGESSHRSSHHLHHHDYHSSGDEANNDGEEDYIAAAEAAIAALGSRVDSRCRSFRDCKPLLIHNSSGTATREFRRAPVQVNHTYRNSKYIYISACPRYHFIPFGGTYGLRQVHLRMSCHFITRPYVSIRGFGTLLKGILAVLQRCSDTFPYTRTLIWE